jgi:cysteinyl-tRNA synthetase
MAQSTAVLGKESVRYWVHNNMITINGQKMGKSLNNFITLEELFTGNNKQLEKAYSPMTIRFFILQAHYRSTLDFSNEALQGAEKAFQRLMNAVQTLQKLKPSEKSSVDVNKLQIACEEAMNDDLNSPVAIASLFEGVRWINSISEGTETISEADLQTLKSLYQTFVFDILGLTNEISSETGNQLVGGLIEMVLNLRTEAKTKKDFQTSDKIRDELTKLGVVVKDKKDGFEWEIK